MLEYKEIRYSDSLPQEVNELAKSGWRIVSSHVLFNANGFLIIMERDVPSPLETFNPQLPVERTIMDQEALYVCKDRVKRYDFSDYTEPTEFISVEDLKNNNFYSDDGEYEAYVSDGFYFIGTNVSYMDEDELDSFIERNKCKFKEPDKIKIYFIDYPEDK